MPDFQRFSTSDVANRERFAYWVDMICMSYVRLESVGGNVDNFFGAVANLALGDLCLSMVQSNAPLVRRPQHIVSTSTDDFLFVHICHTGQARVTQAGRTVYLRPGDITVYHSKQPYELSFDGWFDTRVVKVPTSRVKPFLNDVEDRTALKFRAEMQTSMLIRQMLDCLWTSRSQSSVNGSQFIEGALIQLIASCMSSGTTRLEENTRASDRYLRIAQAYIRTECKRNTLNVREVAQHVGVSTRHLSRIFGEFESSPAKTILNSRLEGCASEIENSLSRSISTIAYDWGFNNMSHFCSVFKARYGVSPSEARNARRLASPRGKEMDVDGYDKCELSSSDES